MKILFTTTIMLFSAYLSMQAQNFGDILKKVTSKDSSSKNILSGVKDILPGKGGSGLGNDDIVSGLKEALRVGTDSSSRRLSKLDGFFGNAAIKILMPPEAQGVERTLRSIGMGGMVDKAILSMNRAAEDAASGVGNIFWNAIRGMTVTDGLRILQGGDFAATEYLKQQTTAQLTEQFRPVINQSLGKVQATKYWNDVFSRYNMVARNKVNTDLSAYVTERALAGLFQTIALEEQKIRKDPAARVTDILRKVFNR